MKLRALKHLIGRRVLFRAQLWASDEFDVSYDWFDEDDWPSDDYSGGPSCGQCGAGVNPHDEDQCWQCGVEL